MSASHAVTRRSTPSQFLARTVLLATVCATAALVWTDGAAAQPDTRGLIGYAVNEVGPKTQDVDQAITRYKNRDYEGAREFLVLAKQKNPELPPADVLMAKLHFTAKQMPAGRASLERAVRDAPKDPEAYLMLADLSMAEGGMTAAGLLYARAAATSQALKGAEKRKRNYLLRTWGGLATIAERRQDWAAAEKQLTEWVKADGDNSSAVERLGRAWFMQNNYTRAEKAFKTARQQDASRPHPDVTMARLYQQLGKPSEAKTLFERALAADGDSASARLAYAQWLLTQNEPGKAKGQLAAVLKQEPDSGDALLLSGLGANMEKDYAAAEGFLKKAHLVAPTNTEVIGQLALALIGQEDEAKRQQATAFAALGARQDPKNGNLGVILGWVFYKLGRTREAEQSLNASLKMRGLSADSRYLVAQVFFDRGRNEPAEQLLKAAVATPGLFVHRREAQALLDKLKK